jgi:hypothetical protein
MAENSSTSASDTSSVAGRLRLAVGASMVFVWWVGRWVRCVFTPVSFFRKALGNNTMSTDKLLRKLTYGHTCLILLGCVLNVRTQLLLFGPIEGCHDRVRMKFRKIIPYV